MKRLRWLVVTGLLGVATAVGAATASGREDRSEQDRTERVRIAIAGPENNLTPYGITFQSGMTIDLINLVYDTLFYSPWARDPEPWLAQDVAISDDRRTWTIVLRDGVRWHDGRPLTAEDVRFSYEYFFDNEQGLYSHHVNQLPLVEKFELVDERTVRFTCREACPTFDVAPGALLPIIPKHVWEDVKDPAKRTGGLPVGSGPYEVGGVVPGRSYTLRANDGYFLGRPLVGELEMPIIPEPAAMFGALRRGEVDAVSRVVPLQAISSLEQAGVEILRRADYTSTQINLNAQREPFDSAAFRSALNLAVDTRPIAQAILPGASQPGVESFLDPDSHFAARDVRDGYDAQAAAVLLEQEGYRDRDGDGARERPNGRPLVLEILVSSGEPREVRASGLVSDQLAKVGVRATVVALNPSTLGERLRPPGAGKVASTKTRRTGDFDMYVATSNEGGHVHSDPDGLLFYFHCPGTAGFGAYITGYCDKRFDRLVERAATLGAKERTPLLQDAQRVLSEASPVISLYFPQGTYAYRPGAYTGWVPETGHGIIHKRSFLPIEGLRRVSSLGPADEAEGAGGTPVWPLAFAGLVVLGTAALVVARRRRRGAAPQGPQVG